ncbi:MAG: MBOAT family protein [Nitrospirae bacterium]|nr:MBOAT family protein [Nitrospirota bacterium]
MLLLASYLFYATWDWRFLSLVLTSTILDYFCGIKIDEAHDNKKKKLFLIFSVASNLSILGIFKYFNFFTYNLQVLFNLLGFSFEPYIFNIVLPMGISYYTFKTMSYTIDIYWGRMRPVRNFLDYALFVSFFPALLSGPIDTANKFLPQILIPRKLTLDKFYEGCYLIFWGLFQKLFIADNLAKFVDPVFAADPPYHGAAVLLAVYAYLFQLYCDFGGYSSIAIGLGKVMGFDMMINFNLPYFAENIADFWQRWHISLSKWVRDYLYTPLFAGLGKLKGKTRLSMTMVTTMTLLGLWHAAAWNFIFYGVYHGILLVIYYLLVQPKLRTLINPKNKFSQSVWKVVRIIFMFHITVIGFLIFRSQSASQIYNMFHSLIFNFKIADIALDKVLVIMSFASILIVVEIVQYVKNNSLIIFKWNPVVRAVFYIVCVYLILFFGVEGGKEFIYAQF